MTARTKAWACVTASLTSLAAAVTVRGWAGAALAWAALCFAVMAAFYFRESRRLRVVAVWRRLDCVRPGNVTRPPYLGLWFTVAASRPFDLPGMWVLEGKTAKGTPTRFVASADRLVEVRL